MIELWGNINLTVLIVLSVTLFAASCVNDKKSPRWISVTGGFVICFLFVSYPIYWITLIWT